MLLGTGCTMSPRQASVTAMELKDWLNVVAVLLSPVFAVQITVWLADRKERRARRLALFHTLMSTRGSLGVNGRLAPEHVKALNMIEIEFHDQKSSKPIVEAWRSYLDHLNNDAPSNEAQWAVWNSKREDLMVCYFMRWGKRLDTRLIRHPFDVRHTHLKVMLMSNWTAS